MYKFPHPGCGGSCGNREILLLPSDNLAPSRMHPTFAIRDR